MVMIQKIHALLPSFAPSWMFGAILLFSSPGFATAESWTDLSGTRTVEGEMIGLWNENLVLRLADGRRISVQLQNLNATSRIQAQNMHRERSDYRSQMVKELQGQAAEAAAPAPNPLPEPQPTSSYLPPSNGVRCVAHLQWLFDQVSAGHLRALYDALPGSYQADLEGLAKAYVAKADMDAWNGSIGALHKVGDLIVTRQRWLFSHPRIEALSSATRDRTEDITLQLGGLLRAGLDPQEFNPSKIQSMPLKNFIAQRSDAMAPYLADLLTQVSPSMGRVAIEEVSEKDGVTSVKITLGEMTINQSFTQVEGMWIESSRAAKWAEDMAAAKQFVADTPVGTAFSGEGILALLPAGLNALLSPLEQAQNRQDFHASASPFLAIVGPQVSQLAQLAGSTSQRGRGGYGDEYMDMEMEGYEEMEEMEDYEDMEMEMEMSGAMP